MQDTAPRRGTPPWQRLVRYGCLASALGGGAGALAWLAWLVWTLKQPAVANELGLISGMLVLIGFVSVSAAGILGLTVMDGD